MNSIKLLFGAVFLLVTSFAIWSCKDDFTEEDLLRQQAKNDSLAAVQAAELSTEQDSVALSILVFNASSTSRTAGGRTSATQGLAGLTIKLNTQGSTKTATTTTEGANFWVQGGSVSGTVSGPGVATANFTISVTEAEDFEDNSENGETVTNAAVELPVFTNAGALATVVSGVVTYEGSLLNDTRETVPNGTVISFEPSAASLAGYYNTGGSYQGPSTPGSGGGADIDAYSLEGNFTATTTNGAFSITLPTGANGLIYNYVFQDFSADQSIAINNYENEPANFTRAVITMPTRFTIATGTPSGTFGGVPTVSPIQVDIADPPAAGSGAAVTVSLLPAPLTFALTTGPTVASGFTVVASGSGYPATSTTVPVTVVGGDFDAAITGATAANLTATTNALGQVTSITGTSTLGTGYRSQATLTVGGGGTGAVIRVNYSSTVASTFGTNAAGTSGTTITAGGSGYDQIPTLAIRGYDILGNYIESETSTVSIANGAVVAIAGSGTFAKLVATSPAVFRTPARTTAIAGATSANALGEVTTTSISGTTGAGYSLATPPTVTVRALRTGIGAAIGAAVATSGAISSLYIISRGSGYPTMANANYPTATGFSILGTATGATLRPGVAYTVNAYYGTGTTRTRGVQ